MPSVHVDRIGEMAIIECAGEFTRKAAAGRLEDAVTSQTEARTVVLDLTEMHSIDGGAIGVLARLQNWAQQHQIRLQLFNPSKIVRNKLKRMSLEIATLEQMMYMVNRIDSAYACALLESQFPSPDLSRCA
ncbi:MAG: STAS domain-containing protein [Candidatus Sulfotelmatobacter sp.]